MKEELIKNINHQILYYEHWLEYHNLITVALADWDGKVINNRFQTKLDDYLSSATGLYLKREYGSKWVVTFYRGHGNTAIDFDIMPMSDDNRLDKTWFADNYKNTIVKYRRTLENLKMYRANPEKLDGFLASLLEYATEMDALIAAQNSFGDITEEVLGYLTLPERWRRYFTDYRVHRPTHLIEELKKDLKGSDFDPTIQTTTQGEKQGYYD